MKRKYQALEINYKRNKHSVSIIDKYFRKLKKNEVSEPTSPEEPVINTYFIKKISLFYFYLFSSSYKFHSGLFLI